jgi:hypothetical protein
MGMRRACMSTTQHGFDAPLWTLHLAFYGSLLVMLLVKLRASTIASARAQTS